MLMLIVHRIVRTVVFVKCGAMVIIYVKQIVTGKRVSILIRYQSLVFIVVIVRRLYRSLPSQTTSPRRKI